MNTIKFENKGNIKKNTIVIIAIITVLISELKN